MFTPIWKNFQAFSSKFTEGRPFLAFSSLRIKCSYHRIRQLFLFLINISSDRSSFASSFLPSGRTPRVGRGTVVVVYRKMGLWNSFLKNKSIDAGNAEVSQDLYSMQISFLHSKTFFRVKVVEIWTKNWQNFPLPSSLNILKPVHFWRENALNL